MRSLSAIARLKSAKGAAGSAAISRQVYELTLADLERFPVWEFRVDEQDRKVQDESTVRPFTSPGPLDPADRMFIVRTAFTLADGSKMKGYLTPPDRGDDSLGTLQPIIITERGQIRFWCGTAGPDSKRLARSYEMLEKEPPQVFPLQFESEVEMVSGPVRGSLSGFLVLENFQTRKTRIIK